MLAKGCGAVGPVDTRQYSLFNVHWPINKQHRTELTVIGQLRWPTFTACWTVGALNWLNEHALCHHSTDSYTHARAYHMWSTTGIGLRLIVAEVVHSRRQSNQTHANTRKHSHGRASTAVDGLGENVPSPCAVDRMQRSVPELYFGPIKRNPQPSAVLGSQRLQCSELYEIRSHISRPTVRSHVIQTSIQKHATIPRRSKYRKAFV